MIALEQPPPKVLFHGKARAATWHRELRRISDRALLHADLDELELSAAQRRRADRALRRLLKIGIPGYDPWDQAGDCVLDCAAARRAIRFFPTMLRHVKGAKAGEAFDLEPWQQAVHGNTFGWKRPDGTRRYREVLLFVPKKNGKTAYVAGVVIQVLTTDGELGAELYSAAASRDQAALIFQHASGFVRLESELEELLDVYGAKGGSQHRAIVYQGEMSSYKCLASDAHTADGTSPHLVAADELHRHKDGELVEVLVKSTAARKQPLVLYTTTSDYNRVSICNTKLAYGISVRDNKGDRAKPGYDPSFLPVIYGAHRDQDWEDPRVWRAANPNLGVTFEEDFLAREVQKAKEMPTELNNLLRLHLNIVTDAEQAWLRADKWAACAGEVDPEEMKKHANFAGLDLAATDDTTALVLFCPDAGNMVLPFFWMPAERARIREKQHRVPYRLWAEMGLVELTPGDYVDQTYVLRRMLEVCAEFNVTTPALDRNMARQITAAASDAGVEVTSFAQTATYFNASCKRLETLVAAGDLRHGGNEVLTWQAGNVVIYRDGNDNIKPDKKRSSEKIDGFTALAMAIAMSMEHEDASSVYEQEGVEPIVI